ncbi:hypothetical protein RI367_004637 [Sorochytrium milnesiophthora]
MAPRPLLSWAFVALAWSLSVAALRSDELRFRTPYPFLVATALSGVLALAVAVTPRSSDTIFADVQRAPWRSYLVQIVPYSLLSSIALVLFIKAMERSSMGSVLFVLLARYLFAKAPLPLTAVAIVVDAVLFKIVGHSDDDLRSALLLAGCMLITNAKHKLMDMQTTSGLVNAAKPRRMLYHTAPTVFLMSTLLFVLFEAPYARYHGLLQVNYFGVFLCAAAYTLSRFSSSIMLLRDDDLQTLIVKLAREVTMFAVGWLFTREWVPIGHVLIYPPLAMAVFTFYSRYNGSRGYALAKSENHGALPHINSRRSSKSAAVDDHDGHHGHHGSGNTGPPAMAIFWRTIPMLVLQFAAVSMLLYTALCLMQGRSAGTETADLVFRLQIEPVEQAPNRHYRFQPSAGASHEYLASVPLLSSLPTRSSVLPRTRKERVGWNHLAFAVSSYPGSNAKFLYRLEMWGKRPEIDWTLYWEAAEPKSARDTFRKEFERVLPHRKLKWDFIDEKSPHVRWFKMLPLLYKSASEDVQWFLMGDDDTMWLPDNLLELLNKYDPTEPLYLGSVTEMAVQAAKYGDIAYGGGGTALSRPMVEKILPIFDECLEKFKDLYGGDGRLGECIRLAGYRLTHELGFNQFDLWDVRDQGDVKAYISSHMSLHYPVSMHRHDGFGSFLPEVDAKSAGALLMHLTERIPRDLMFRRFWWIVKPTATDDKSTTAVHAGDFDLVGERSSRNDYYHDSASLSLFRPRRSSQAAGNPKTVVMVFGYHIRVYNSVVSVNLNEHLQDGKDYTYTDFWFNEWRVDRGEMLFLDPYSGRKIAVRCHSHGGNLESLCL